MSSSSLLNSVLRTQQVANNSSLVTLLPFLDSDGLIRMTTRLTQNESVSEAEKYLIILPKHNTLVEKLVLHLHTLHGHLGLSNTEFVLRKRYWVIGGKREIRRILHQCKNLECRPLKPIQQQMSSLPAERFMAQAPFTHVSVDSAGPIYCYHQCKLAQCPHPTRQKLYICLFSCWYSRSCHLEIVQDLSTTTFLAALQRLMARRGCPSFIFSDQHRSYKQASQEIKKLYAKIDFAKIQNYLVQRGVTWKFSIPVAPWTNSLVERMVRSVKRALRASLGTTRVTDIQQLETLIQQVEALINNRPLTTCTSDTKDSLPVTPALLTIGRPLTTLPEIDETMEMNPRFVKMYEIRQKFMERFHKAWRRDYCLMLQSRQKWHTTANPLKVGSICLVHDQALSRNAWKIAKVVKIKEGGDKLQRLVKLQVPHSSLDRRHKFIWRHINALSLLEDASQEEADLLNTARPDTQDEARSISSDGNNSD